MIVVRRTYRPRPGAGGKLLALVRQAAEAMHAAGFARPSVLRQAFGDHGTLITEQRWESLAAYDASRGAVRETTSITGVFERIYPLLAATHHTEILVELD